MSDELIPKRVNVAVTPDTARALQRMIDEQGVTLTEAVRRLIGYGDYVYNAIKNQHARVLVETETTSREVILL